MCYAVFPTLGLNLTKDIQDKAFSLEDDHTMSRLAEGYFTI